MPRIVKIAGVVATVAVIAISSPSNSQSPGAFAPPIAGNGLSGSTPPESFDEGHFDATLDGPRGIQATDPAAAEARRQGLISGLNVALEEILNRPTDLLLGGILRNSNDNNIGGTNNP